MKNSTFRRYVVIGFSVYIFELLVIVVAQRLGSSPIIAIAFSFWLGLIVSFTLQKFISFQDKRTHHKIVLVQLFAYSALVLFNFGFTLLLAKIIGHHLPAVVTRSFALGVTTLWNFSIYRSRIFIKSGHSGTIS